MNIQIERDRIARLTPDLTGVNPARRLQLSSLKVTYGTQCHCEQSLGSLCSRMQPNTTVMSKSITKNPPSYFSLQPASYWEESDPLTTILRNVKGTNRRQMITDFWNQGRFSDLNPMLLTDSASPELCRELGAIHPSFMGGEYLPDFLPTEVEIARIELKSTTSDVVLSLIHI